jgi:hypothetical protein
VVLPVWVCPELGRGVDAEDVPVVGVVAVWFVGVVLAPGVVLAAAAAAAAAELFISVAIESVSPRIAMTCSSSLN